jgi:hypothetical protein
LTDAVSAEIGMGPDCVVMYGYDTRKCSLAAQAEANQLVHGIASTTFSADEARAAIFRLFELGFVELSKRIERRIGRWIATSSYVVVATPELPIAEPVKIEPLPFALTAGQEQACEAVRKIMRPPGHALCVVAGYAGTGKTTLLRALALEYGSPVVITPTGKAALRVREATKLSASTIHRWLYVPKENEKTGAVRFVRRELGEIFVPRSRLVVIDEASMVGPDVWKDVYTICQQLDLKLVLVGDGFQLPPVLPPGVPPFSVLLPEFAAQLKAERIEMTEVLRQAQGSPVIRASMAIRNGGGLRALSELPRLDLSQIANVAVSTHQQGGVTICHRNVTRFQINAGIRMTLGIYDEMPRAGEPLLVLKNVYEAGVVNGESFLFEGWTVPPESFERVFDRYKPVEEDTRFGATTIGRVTATLSIEEIHGRLTAGTRAIQIAAGKWARMQNVYSGDSLAPHIPAQFGYCYTAHKSQGSEWPYVLVVIEPSVRFDEEEGRRWVYTALTRASKMAAVYVGRI